MTIQASASLVSLLESLGYLWGVLPSGIHHHGGVFVFPQSYLHRPVLSSLEKNPKYLRTLQTERCVWSGTQPSAALAKPLEAFTHEKVGLVPVFSH